MRLDQLLPTIANLRPDDVQNYLRSRGWSPVPDPRTLAVVYSHPLGNEVDVPLEPKLFDYGRRMAELVEMVAMVEQRSPVEVFSDLSLPPCDLLHFRVHSEQVGSGTLPFLEGLRLREAQKNLLLSVAHSAIQPQRYFPQLSRKEPTELLAQCREGQTTRGSYVMNVLVPVEPAIGRLPLEEPLGRRVTRLLMQTLGDIQQRLRCMDGEALLNVESRGMSANLLGALGEMYPPGEGSRLEIGVRWSRNRPPPVDTLERVQFIDGYFPMLRAAAGAMREQHPCTCELSGYVARLGRSAESPETSGDIVLVAQLGDPPVEARVHVSLPAKIYNDLAITAHREGRRLRITGILHREGRRWRLQEPNGVMLLVGEEE